MSPVWRRTRFALQSRQNRSCLLGRTTMFDWLGPKCPLDTYEKMWTECRMRWLVEKLGLDRLVGAEVILPEHRYFPDPYSGTPADAQRIFDRVCGYMKLDPDRFDLQVLADDAIEGAVGLYSQGERPQIVLAYAQLSDPERLVATIAHELAHDILLGGGLITASEQDHEPLTDLVPVFLGLGLFTANAPVRDRSYSQNNWHYFKIDRQGYLSSCILGYALALFAFVRGEAKPSWVRYLRPDAGEPLKKGLRYLLKTGDSLFHPDTAHLPVNPPTVAEVIERLTIGSPTVRAITLRDVAALDPPPAALLDSVVRRLRDPDADVQVEAVHVLPNFGEAARVAVPDLLWCLTSRSATLRSSAAVALSAVAGPAAEVVTELTRLLQDPDSRVVDDAASGLGRFALCAASAVPALVEAIRKNEVLCRSSDALATALIAIDPPAVVLERLLAGIDPEIRELVARSLRTARARGESDRSSSSAQIHRYTFSGIRFHTALPTNLLTPAYDQMSSS